MKIQLLFGLLLLVFSLFCSFQMIVKEKPLFKIESINVLVLILAFIVGAYGVVNILDATR